MGSIKPKGDGTQARLGRCSICGAVWEPAFRPFCSRRCADVDLSRWLGGGYAIAGNADVDEDGDEADAASGLDRHAAKPEGNPED